MITKQYCKECILLKELSEFYSHPLGKNGVTGRCKECIKKGRRSEEERIMSRIRDNKRSLTPDRLKHNTNNTRQWRKNNPEKYKANGIVNNYFRYRKKDKPKQCSNCLVIPKESKGIALHHEDYNKPREIIPLCKLCHKQYHSGIIEIDKSKKIIIPF